MRKRIYEVIEVAGEDDRLSRVYDLFMMITIILSLIPIAVKSEEGFAGIIDIVTAVIFIIDYLLRWTTADYKVGKGKASFVIYPFTPMAIIDLLAVLPSILAVNAALRVLKVLRLLRTFRVFRIFKVVRYSKSISMVINVFKKQKDALLVVCGLAFGYIVISALVVICVEPDTFPTFFDALYWATVSLTTVGYGDIYATSLAGKVITMISSIFGIAIVALPAGIVTAGYMEEVQKRTDEKNNT